MKQQQQQQQNNQTAAANSTLVYSQGHNNIYIKTYRQQNAHQQFEALDSNYSTPINSGSNKKLVYEVIV